jgi:hypothetical protein
MERHEQNRMANLLRTAGWTCRPPVRGHFEGIDTSDLSSDAWEQMRREWRDTGLPPGTFNAFLRNGLSISAARETDDADLLQMRNFGERRLSQFRRAVGYAASALRTRCTGLTDTATPEYAEAFKLYLALPLVEDSAERRRLQELVEADLRAAGGQGDDGAYGVPDGFLARLTERLKAQAD